MKGPILAGVTVSVLITLGILWGTVPSRDADNGSIIGIAKLKAQHEHSISFEGRIREIAPNAIRFQGSFVLPTNEKTAYFRQTENGEMQIDREDLDSLIEELDENPYVIEFNNDIKPIPSFRLGGRVRCEYVPGQSATKVVIQFESKRPRRTRNNYWSTFHDFEILKDESSQNTVHRRISLNARSRPLKDVLSELARSAELQLKIDLPAINRDQIDLNSPVTMQVIDKPFGEGLCQLFDFDSSNETYFRIQDGTWFISTLSADDERRKMQELPEWLNTDKVRGVHPDVDENGQVVSLSVQAATDEISQLKTLPKLRELDISPLDVATPSGFAVLEELDSVEKLSLGAIGGHCPSAKDMEEITGHLGRMKSLHKLTLNHTGITDEGMRHLAALPLTELELDHEGRLTDQAIGEIARIKSMKSLRVINYIFDRELGAMRFSSVGLGQLAALPNLNSLEFAGQPAPKRLGEFPKLTQLQLSGPRADNQGRIIEILDDNSAADIAEASQLKYLTIEKNEFTGAGWWIIGNLPELRGIRLFHITDSDIKILASRELPKLTEIHVTSMRLTDVGIGYLSKFQSVTRMDLCGSSFALAGGSSFTLAGLAQLKAASNLRTLNLFSLKSKTGYLSLKELTQLQELYLEQLPIPLSEYNELERALPNTRIYAGHGTRWLWSIRDQN